MSNIKYTKEERKNKKINEIKMNSNPGSLQQMQTHWWRAKPAEAYQGITTVVDGIKSNQSFRTAMFLRYGRLYANREIQGYGAWAYGRGGMVGGAQNINRVSYNVVKSCVDTAASKIAKMTPRVMALTSDGDWALQEKAKKLTTYLDGQFELTNLYEKAAQAFVDSCVFGSGFLKIYHDGQKICADRVFPSEIYVDDAEAIYGEPRQMTQEKYVARSVLEEMYADDKKKLDAIKGCQSASEQGLGANSTADLIEVRESWHLRSGENASDGCHAITIKNCTLEFESYDKDYFPILKLDWTRGLLGFFGIGLAEELLGIQVEINRLLRNIQQAQNLACIPRIFVEKTSHINEADLNNKIGAIVPYVGNPPIISAGQGMAVEVYQHLETLYKRAFEITGISLLSATAMKPSGLNSSLALREYQDIETERFALAAKTYENLFPKISEVMIDLSKELYEINPKLSVKVKGSKFVDSIPWKEVDMADDIYSLRLYPVNILPSKPEGRLQKIQELVQSGFFSKEEAFSLIDFPDLEAVTSMKNAPYDIAMMMIYQMIGKGKYTPPEPFMNLALTKTLTQYSYLKAKTTGVPEDRLELLRRFIEDCVSLETIAAQAAATGNIGGMQDPNAAAPIATPAAPPTSDLLPLPTVTPPV